jgi:hypothetical protein
MLHKGNLPYRPIPGLRTGEQLCASMIRIGSILGQATLDQQVGDTLHPLAGHAHATRYPSHAAGLIKDSAEHLPPRGGKPAVGAELLSRLHETGVETEGGEDDIGQQGTGLGLRHRLRPVSPGRNGGRIAVPGSVHAAF